MPTIRGEILEVIPNPNPIKYHNNVILSHCIIEYWQNLKTFTNELFIHSFILLRKRSTLMVCTEDWLPIQESGVVIPAQEIDA